MERESSNENFSDETLPTTHFQRSIESRNSADWSFNHSHMIRLRIFGNVSGKANNDCAVLIHEGMVLRRELTVQTSFAVYLNAQISKTKVIALSQLGEGEKRKADQGYRLLGKILNGSEKGSFDVKSVPGAAYIQKRDILRGTFVNLTERGFNGVTLKSQDIIKLGRQIFRVTIVDETICPNFRWLRTLKQQKESLQGMCRVCLCCESSKKDFLISPCACSGSCGLIHIECLRKWLGMRMIVYRNEKVMAYNLEVFQCEVCHADFPKYMRLGQQLIELFPLSMECDSFVMLQRICERNAIAYIVPFREGVSVSVKIGRHEQNDLVLSDMSISRRHAVLQVYGGGQVEILDCGSKFGTFVELRRDLYNCRQITLMSDRFRFQFDVASTK